MPRLSTAHCAADRARLRSRLGALASHGITSGPAYEATRQALAIAQARAHLLAALDALDAATGADDNSGEGGQR